MILSWCLVILLAVCFWLSCMLPTCPMKKTRKSCAISPWNSVIKRCVSKYVQRTYALHANLGLKTWRILRLICLVGMWGFVFFLNLYSFLHLCIEILSASFRGGRDFMLNILINPIDYVWCFEVIPSALYYQKDPLWIQD